MAWHEIPYSEGWEYNDSPEEPPISSGQHALWEKQVNGIRAVGPNTVIYVDCRRVGSIVEHAGELNKTYWDYIAVREGGGVPPVEPPVDLTNIVEISDGVALYWDTLETDLVEIS